MLFFLISLLILGVLATIVFFIRRKKYIIVKYENSEQTKFKTQVNNNKQKNGDEILYRPNGKKNKVSHWKEGIRNGAFIVYWPNGKKYIEGSYKDGKLSGEYNVFSEEGKVIFHQTY